MRRATLAVVLGIVLALGLPMPTAGQEGDDIQILDVDTSGYPRIELSVAIPPSLGDGPLNGSDFALTESASPRPTAVVAQRDDIDVVLAIDTSGSMRSNDALARAKQAAMTLVEGLPEDAQIGVVGFGSTTFMAGPLTKNRTETLAAIDSLDFSGNTALWDALVESASVLGTDAGTSRYVVVLTDGTDDGSSATRSAALEALTGTNISLYAIGLETNETNFSDLETSVEAVGGGFDTAEDTGALSSVYGEIAERLTNRYRLSFDAAGTGEREIIVSVATEGGLATVRRTIDVGGTAAHSTAQAPVAPSFPPQLGTTTAPGVFGLGQAWSLWLGAGAFFVAFAVLAYVALRPEAQVRLGGAGQSGVGTVSGLPDRLTSATGRALAGSERGSQLDRSLDAAGMEIRPGELVVLVAVLAAIVGLGITAVTDFVFGLLGALLVPLVAYLVVARKLRNRRAEFADQLGDTLTILAGALRAGRGVPQAVELIAEETASPTRDEFRRVIIESRVGRDVTESLMDVADRMQNDDFRWLAEAIAINQELGGDLAEILDNIASVVRDRNQMRLQIRALAAEGRLSGYILVALPVLLFFYLRLVNPDYIGELLSGTGLFVLLLGIAAIGLGSLWIRNLVKFDY